MFKKQSLILLLLCFQSLQGSTLRFSYNKDGHTHVMSPSFLRDICTAFDRSIFVETGTYCGETTGVAATLCSQVHSVEMSEDLYKNATQRLQAYSNVQLYNGHSVFFLDRFCSQRHADAHRMVFWLDAHYSGGVTTQYNDQSTPIIGELKALADNNMGDAVIMIDDVRCFGSLYKQQELAACPGYPSLQKVCQLLKAINPNYACVLYGDTLIAYDAVRYNPSISPVMHACTYSRLYDGDGDLSSSIVEQEALISVPDQEKDVLIFLLHERAMRQQEDVHAFLWYGLMIAKTWPKLAQTAFRKVLERGYTHWRIYWYSAQAAYDAADYDVALQYAQQTVERNPDYAPAVDLQQKIAALL